MYIRDLQSRIQFLRNDLPAGFAEQALQDAARWVARKTGIVRHRVYGSVSNGQYRVVLKDFMLGNIPAGIDPLTYDFDILRPTLLMFNPGMNVGSSYVGQLNSITNTVPAATGSYLFHVATEDVVVTSGANTYSLKEGDTLQDMPNGPGQWVIQPFYKYTVAIDIKDKRLFGAVREPLNNTGYISNYVVTKDEILLSPVPVNDTSIMLECSIVPRKNFDTVDFPVDAEDAILVAAMAQFIGTPNKAGGGADKALSSKLWQKAEGEMSLVRALAEGGYGDSEMIPPIHFGN